MPCRAHGSLLPLVVEGLVVSERVDGLEDLVAEAALVLHADRLVEVANVNAQAGRLAKHLVAIAAGEIVQVGILLLLTFMSRLLVVASYKRNMALGKTR